VREEWGKYGKEEKCWMTDEASAKRKDVLSPLQPDREVKVPKMTGLPDGSENETAGEGEEEEEGDGEESVNTTQATKINARTMKHMKGKCKEMLEEVKDLASYGTKVKEGVEDPPDLKEAIAKMTSIVMRVAETVMDLMNRVEGEANRCSGRRRPKDKETKQAMNTMQQET
jgi:hypothetical protein